MFYSNVIHALGQTYSLFFPAFAKSPYHSKETRLSCMANDRIADPETKQILKAAPFCSPLCSGAIDGNILTPLSVPTTPAPCSIPQQQQQSSDLTGLLPLSCRKSSPGCQQSPAPGTHRAARAEGSDVRTQQQVPHLLFRPFQIPLNQSNSKEKLVSRCVKRARRILTAR